MSSIHRLNSSLKERIEQSESSFWSQHRVGTGSHRQGFITDRYQVIIHIHMSSAPKRRARTNTSTLVTADIRYRRDCTRLQHTLHSKRSLTFVCTCDEGPAPMASGQCPSSLHPSLVCAPAGSPARQRPVKRRWRGPLVRPVVACSPSMQPGGCLSEDPGMRPQSALQLLLMPECPPGWARSNKCASHHVLSDIATPAAALQLLLDVRSATLGARRPRWEVLETPGGLHDHEPQRSRAALSHPDEKHPRCSQGAA